MSSVHKYKSPPPTPPLRDIRRDTPPPDTDDIARPPRVPSPDNCPICLDAFNNKTDRSYSDNCFHIFCFACLLEWSNNKRECPLCKKAFTAIYHKITDTGDYQVHQLPPPPPAEPQDRSFPWSNVTWEWMRQMRQQFMRNRQRQLERIRNGTSRYEPLGSRNVLRPATTDRRRFVYRYELYCEGADTVGGGTRYRRTTPEFYRRNPAILHRLVPWLNRELVAILPHSDNVQFVLDLILAEIKRVDIRSPEFREAIQPFILGYTDHFIHEFRMFAMSPLDMAGFDSHAQYPTARGARRPSSDDERAGAARRTHANLTRPPSSSSSSDSDSDIDIVARGSGRPSHLVTAVMYHTVPPPEAPLVARRSARMSWHRQRLIAEELGTLNPVMTLSAHRHTRWDAEPETTPTENRESRARRHSRPRTEEGHVRTRGDMYRLTHSQREANNRLERSLRSMESNSSTSLRGPVDHSSTTYTRTPSHSEPHPAQPSGQAESSGYPGIVSRVRSFLDNIDDELSNDGAPNTSNMSMPLLHELTGEDNSEAPAPQTNTSLRLFHALHASDMPSTSSEDVARAYGLLPHQAQGSAIDERPPARRQRSDSPTSSDSSDVILVSEEKPYRTRTPIELFSNSSSSDESEPVQTALPAAEGRTSRLSESSDKERELGRRWLIPRASPSASCQPVYQSSSHTHFQSSTSDSDISTCCCPAATAAAPGSPQRTESTDSDCIVTFEAAKPKHLQQNSPEKSSPTKRKSKKRKHEKSQSRDRKTKKRKANRPSKHHKHVLAGRDPLPSAPKDIFSTHQNAPTRHYAESDSSDSSDTSSIDLGQPEQARYVRRRKRKTDFDCDIKQKKRHDLSSPPAPNRYHDSSPNGAAKNRLAAHSALQTSNDEVSPPAGSPLLDVTGLGSNTEDVTGLGSNTEPSQSSSSELFIAYSPAACPQERADDCSSPDIRKQIRHFAKNKIAEKYNGKRYKKHNKGHKNR